MYESRPGSVSSGLAASLQVPAASCSSNGRWLSLPVVYCVPNTQPSVAETIATRCRLACGKVAARLHRPPAKCAMTPADVSLVSTCVPSGCCDQLNSPEPPTAQPSCGETMSSPKKRQVYLRGAGPASKQRESSTVALTQAEPV